jgi:hypothetical protein
MEFKGRYNNIIALTSVADPNSDPPDPRVFVPPGYGSINHLAKVVRKTLISTVL